MLLASVVLPPVIDSVSLEALQFLRRMKWDLLRLPLNSLKELQKLFHAVIVVLTISTDLVDPKKDGLGTRGWLEEVYCN